MRGAGIERSMRGCSKLRCWGSTRGWEKVRCCCSIRGCSKLLTGASGRPPKTRLRSGRDSCAGASIRSFLTPPSLFQRLLRTDSEPPLKRPLSGRPASMGRSPVASLLRMTPGRLLPVSTPLTLMSRPEPAAPITLLRSRTGRSVLPAGRRPPERTAPVSVGAASCPLLLRISRR